MNVTRICLWSGPRNVSTALMYSFAQRSDARVVDEPLYAHYLRLSGVEHPGREEVLAAQNHDGEAVVREIILGPCERPVLFMKQMAHHLVGLNFAFLEQTINVLLVREPSEMLRSLVNQLPNPRLDDTGMKRQVELLRHLQSLGQDPPVLDAREILLDPRGVLSRLCRKIGLEFEQGMLAWSAGALPEDGVWARHWYHSVHRSTGFQAYRPKTGPLPRKLEAVYEACRPYYDELYAHAIRAETVASSVDETRNTL